MTDNRGVELDGFERCCTLTADLSSLATSANRQLNLNTYEEFLHLSFKGALRLTLCTSGADVDVLQSVSTLAERA